jgi:predicted peptidase
VAICGGGDVPYVGKIAHLPTRVFHGAKDDAIPISESRQMVDALRAAGGDVEFTIYPDAKHDAWTQMFADDGLYRWMLKQRRRTSH